MPSFGCDMGCDGGCDSCCDSGCGIGALDCLTGDCCLGDPYTLFGELDNGWSMGGWASLGYHSAALPIFNDRPDELNLHQAWLYAEKAIDTSCGFDIGGRIDYLYGIDAQNTQAFGTDPRGWDNGWDNGEYGHALPQAYLEAGYGDLSVKVGHFYTIIGWEVVPATGNFFYSHAYTFNYSEPFTHTGALATYNASDDVTVWGGYTMGWDSGFDDNGDAFLGGISLGLTDDLNLIYATTIGQFGRNAFNGDEQGYMHSIVADYAVTDSLQYIIQSDLLSTEDGAGVDARNTFGINQYLIKTLSDCWAVGGRFEWYNNEGIDFGNGATAENDIYALTLGVNHRPHANVTIRPEIRWDWDDDQVVGLQDGEDQTTFGIDTVFTF
ncbi:porin [Rubripirellula obstinata]